MSDTNYQSAEDLQVSVVNDNPLLISCPACGTKISRYASKCIKCGQPINSVMPPMAEPNAIPQQQIVINQPSNKTNGVGTAGFVLSLISLVLSWIPGVNFLVWFIGMLLSFIGMFKKPRGLAIAGFCISIIGIILLILIFGALAGIFAAI